MNSTYINKVNLVHIMKVFTKLALLDPDVYYYTLLHRHYIEEISKEMNKLRMG